MRFTWQTASGDATSRKVAETRWTVGIVTMMTILNGLGQDLNKREARAAIDALVEQHRRTQGDNGADGLEAPREADAPGDWHPNEVDASSRRRGGKICERVDGERHQQPVHAQDRADAHVAGPPVATGGGGAAGDEWQCEAAYLHRKTPSS